MSELEFKEEVKLHKIFYFHYWNEEEGRWAIESENEGAICPIGSFGKDYQFAYKLWFIRNLADAPEWVRLKYEGKE